MQIWIKDSYTLKNKINEGLFVIFLIIYFHCFEEKASTQLSRRLLHEVLGKIFTQLQRWSLPKLKETSSAVTRRAEI